MGSTILCPYRSTMGYLDSSDSQCYRYTQNMYHLPWHHNLNYYYYLYIDLKLHCSTIKCMYISTVKYGQCYRDTQNTYHLPWHHNLNYYHYLNINLKLQGYMTKCPYISTMKYLGYCDSQCYWYIIYLGITILTITITCI